MSEERYCEVDFSDYSDDADPVEFFNIKTVKARKPHQCSERNATIARSESYQRVDYKFEGQMGTDYVCEPCAETKAEFNYNIFGGDLWAHLWEAWDSGAPQLPAFLAAGNLKGFISDDLAVRLVSPVQYRPKHGGRTAFGPIAVALNSVSQRGVVVSDLHDSLALTCSHPVECRKTLPEGKQFCAWCEDLAMLDAVSAAFSELWLKQFPKVESPDAD